MAINFKLGPRREVGDEDEMRRGWGGFEDGMSAEAAYRQNRGLWHLGPRAYDENYATFSVDGVVRFVYELTGAKIEEIPALTSGRKPRKAFVGRPLSPGHTAYDRLIGRQVDSNRNPVSYLPDDPDDEPARRCACGCDTEVPPGRNFAAGHDQRAVRERIAKRWGSTLAFVRWFDADEDARAA